VWGGSRDVNLGGWSARVSDGLGALAWRMADGAWLGCQFGGGLLGGSGLRWRHVLQSLPDVIAVFSYNNISVLDQGGKSARRTCQVLLGGFVRILSSVLELRPSVSPKKKIQLCIF
jgi:hypothetical protein